MAPAIRKGIRYCVNFCEYMANVWLTISPMVSSRVGFLFSINFSSSLDFCFVLYVY